MKEPNRSACAQLPAEALDQGIHERVRVQYQNQLSFACLARWGGGTLLIMQVVSGDAYLSSYEKAQFRPFRWEALVEAWRRGQGNAGIDAAFLLVVAFSEDGHRTSTP